MANYMLFTAQIRMHRMSMLDEQQPCLRYGLTSEQVRALTFAAVLHLWLRHELGFYKGPKP